MNIELGKVTFELARLLSQRGYSKDVYNHEHDEVEWDKFKENILKVYFPLPTIENTLLWLHIVKGIWVRVKPDCYGECWYAELSISCQEVWENVDLRNQILNCNHLLRESKSPAEAYLGAFKCILENLELLHTTYSTLQETTLTPKPIEEQKEKE